MKDIFDNIEEQSPIQPLIPLILPTRLPNKHELKFMRKEFYDKVAWKYGSLKAYIIAKAYEKLVADKDEGLIKTLKSEAETEFNIDLKGVPQSILGVKISNKGMSYWIYSDELQAKMDDLKKQIAEIEALQKEEQRNGLATKADGNPGLVVFF